MFAIIIRVCIAPFDLTRRVASHRIASCRWHRATSLHADDSLTLRRLASPTYLFVFVFHRQRRFSQINVLIDSSGEQASSQFAAKCDQMSPKNLSLEEKKYLLAVRDGDLANVKK